MDTISRDSSPSYLPIAGAIVAVIALIVGGVALVKVSSLGKRVPEDLPEQLQKLDTSVQSASASADKASKDIVSLTRSTQAAFDSIGPEIGKIKESVTKLEEAAKAREAARSAKGKGGAAAVAGPGEYIVKPGDTGMKIAKATGVSLEALESANPGIDWRRLRVGQTVKTGGK
jgi:LysM repeat protein